MDLPVGEYSLLYLKKFWFFALFYILVILNLLFYYSLTIMKKNLKQLLLLWILGLWLASTVTFAETKTDCFWIADSEAWFGWAAIINYQCFDNAIEIPSTIDGKKVTEIWKWAFKNTVLTTVKLPNTLKQISESAFEDNIIEKIEIPEGVEAIDKYAFKNNKLKAIKLPKSLKVIGEEAFYKNNLEKISVPGRLNKVGDNAFCDNVGNEVIWVSDNLEWTWKNSCFKLIKASTVEDTYAGIETDFSTEITEKLWDWIKTDSPEVDELTSILEEMQNTNDTETSEWTGLSEEDRENLNQLVEDSEDTLTGEELDDELEFGGIQGFGSGNGVSGVWVTWSPVVFWAQGVPSAHALTVDDDRWDFFDWLGWMLALFWSLFWFFWLMWLVSMIYESLLVISIWEIYKKAWKRWWAFLVPVYNTMVLAEIAEDNKWRGVLPWLTPFIALWVTLADLWIIGSYAAAILGLISSVLVLWWNYKIARRFGWSVICSIANVLFTPITILFLWLRNDEYQPKKLSYDLNKPQVNEPEKTVPAPVVASEQLNNVVEHFVWPEEEPVNETTAETVSEPVSESVVETVAEPITEPVAESTNESTQTENEEIKEESNTSDEIDLTVKNEEEPEWVSEDVDLSLNSESTEEVPASEITESESSMDNEIDLSNNEGISDEEVNSLQLNLDDEFAQIDDTETPIWEIKTEEENEIILDDKPETEVTESSDTSVEASDEVNEVTEATEAPQGITEGNVETTEEANAVEVPESSTETILPSLDPELTKDNSEASESEENSEIVEESSTETILPSLDPELTKDNSENTESNEGQEKEETETDEISEEELVTEPGEEPIAESGEQVEQSMEVDGNESNSSETQDMWTDESLFEDLPQDIVDGPYNGEQVAEGNESTQEEDTTQYPDEPISDLDQLMANNNKSL